MLHVYIIAIWSQTLILNSRRSYATFGTKIPVISVESWKSYILLVCVCGNWFGTKNGAQTLVGGFLQEIRAESRLICYCTSWQRTPILDGAGWSCKQKPKMAEKFSPNYDLFTQKPFNCKVCLAAYAIPIRTHHNHSSEIRGLCLMKCSSKMLFDICLE